jgi:hypothetical protein
MPSCSRCQQDDKPCFYAKSRRGMRDKNAPRKRASVKEQGRGRSASDQSGYPSSSGSLVGNSSSESWPGLSSGAPSPASPSSRLSSIQPAVDPRRLIDLYYKFVARFSCLTFVTNVCVASFIKLILTSYQRVNCSADGNRIRNL